MVDKKKINFDSSLDQVFGETNFEKSKDYLHIMPHEEPHSRRRKAIMAKYKKEIEKLMIKDPRSLLISIAITITQLTIAYNIQN
mmetsp:Transcript_134917/g.190743  ORF Transcript_134917/g.190743 Transcript_134917/m.190743 type:complete len:84 (-) Transcript_134917:808-1059(-)